MRSMCVDSKMRSGCDELGDSFLVVKVSNDPSKDEDDGLIHHRFLRFLSILIL